MLLRHHVGQSLELYSSQSENPLWRYVYGGKPKPFFHPLHTPAGFCLSLFEPSDHFWHRGLWFTIKYINGENFWEENGDFGIQSTLLPPSVTHEESGVITWTHEQHWERPHNAGHVFHETRRITYIPLETTAYALDWDIRLTAQADLLLDRSPFTTWGGYGGLTLRGNRNWHNTRLLLDDDSTHDRPVGVPALWADLSGTFDGGAEKSGGMAMFDHPANRRHPSPWYGSTGSGHYFNAAFLFHEPLQLSEGEELHLRYRTLIHDEIWDTARLQSAYNAYAELANDD